MKRPEISTRFFHVAREKGSTIDRYFVVGHHPLIFIDLDNGKTLYEKDFNEFFNSVGFYDDVYPHKKKQRKWLNPIRRIALIFAVILVMLCFAIEVFFSWAWWAISGKWQSYTQKVVFKMIDKMEELTTEQ